MNEKRQKDSVSSQQCRCMGPCFDCTCKKQDERKDPEAAPRIITTAMIWLLVFCTAAWGQATESTGRPGLLIIAHGSPSPAWNQPVIALEQKVEAALGADNPYGAVEVVFMEFAEPNVADGMQSLQAAGCNRIVAVPLLIAPSSHSHWDIPALLGIYSDAAIEAMLHEEGLRVMRPSVPVTLTTTLAESDVIERIMLKRVRQLSENPGQEAVVLLAHGSEAIPPSWDRFLMRTITYVCGQTGISYGDWATVAVGQQYDRAVTAIQAAAEHRRRVIVVGAYLSLDAKRMYDSWAQQNESASVMMHAMGNPLEGLNLSFSEQGLLPDELVIEWIAETARQEVQRHPQSR